ncbi:MAG: hypothetical protein QM758_13305 [Armatimonas sp.]
MPTDSPGALEVLNALASAASAAQDQAYQIARVAVDIHREPERFEVVETLANQLQSDAIDIQLRLQMIQDAAVNLGAERPIRTYGSSIVDLRLKDTPATRHLLKVLSHLTEAARAVDEEMGWIDEKGRPIGYYERYAIGHLLLRSTIDENLS